MADDTTLLNNDVLIGMLDLIGQLQVNVIAMRRLLHERGMVTRDELEAQILEVEKTVTPLRVQFLDAVSKAKSFQDLLNLELGEGQRPQ